MYLFVRQFSVSLLVLCLATANFTSAQTSRKIGLILGVAAWPNNCDIPAGGQQTGLGASFGPFFSMNYGKFRLGGTFFTGRFDAHPKDGLRRVSPDTVVFADHAAAEHGFTSTGRTKRVDFDLHIGYEFNRYARLSFSFIANRHRADISTFPYPTLDAEKRIDQLPSERAIPLDYHTTQFWIGQTFEGSAPVRTISAHFSIFYGASLLVFAGETGEGKAKWRGQVIDIGPRASYINEHGEIEVPPRKLGARPFGENVGLAFKSGLSFELTAKPALAVFAGYNIKFFAEDDTHLIDHSVFKGPFAGISMRLF